MVRELYILRGSHAIDSVSFTTGISLIMLHFGDEKGLRISKNMRKEVIKHIDLSCELIYEIGKAKKITQLFHDGCCANAAKNSNSEIEELLKLDDKDARLDIEEMEQKASKNVIYSKGINRIEVTYNLNLEGIPIRFYKTERNDFMDDDKLFQEIMLNDQYIRALFKQGIIKKGQVVDYARDEAIFENVDTLTIDKCIFFIGGEHKLEAFNRKENDFVIYSVNLKYNTFEEMMKEGYNPNSPLEITGKLPMDLKNVMQKLENKERKFNIEYV